jgi:hypothetical protein
MDGKYHTELVRMTFNPWARGCDRFGEILTFGPVSLPQVELGATYGPVAGVALLRVLRHVVPRSLTQLPRQQVPH